MSEPPGAIRAAMMSTWGPVHADGPCVIANPEVLDGMLAALKEARDFARETLVSRYTPEAINNFPVIQRWNAAIAKAEGVPK